MKRNHSDKTIRRRRDMRRIITLPHAPERSSAESRSDRDSALLSRAGRNKQWQVTRGKWQEKNSGKRHAGEVDGPGALDANREALSRRAGTGAQQARRLPKGSLRRGP